MDYPMPICMLCSRYKREAPTFVCSAFPNGIPEAILRNKADHRLPFEGDQGKRFERKRGVSEQAVLVRFGKAGESAKNFA